MAVGVGLLSFRSTLSRPHWPLVVQPCYVDIRDDGWSLYRLNYWEKTEILGGLVLIGIGVQILWTHSTVNKNAARGEY